MPRKPNYQFEKRQKELQAIKVQVDALEAKRATFQKKVDLIERLNPVGCLLHLISIVAEDFGDEAADGIVVLDHENIGHPCCSSPGQEPCHDRRDAD